MHRPPPRSEYPGLERSPLGPAPSRSRDLLALFGAPLALVGAAISLGGALSVSFVASPAPYLAAIGGGCIFAAGSGFGHHFDRDLDQQRHPERPLPSGRVEASLAWRGGWVLLAFGLLLQLAGGLQTLAFGFGTAMAVVVYAAVTRRVWGAGSVTLGLAHALNAAAGFSIQPDVLPRYLAAVIAVGLYATGWSLLRSSRLPTAPPITPFVVLLHLAAAASVLIFAARSGFNRPWEALPFLIGFIAIGYPRFVNTGVDPRPVVVLEAVQYGFLGFTLLAATFAGGYSGLIPGLLVALLLIPQYLLLKRNPIQLATQV